MKLRNSLLVIAIVCGLLFPVLTPAQPVRAALEDDILAYWTLEESSGTRFDYCGGNNVNDENLPLATAGVIGNAVDLVRSSNQKLQAGLVSSLDLGNTDYTLAAWVYLDTLPSYPTELYPIFSRYNDPGGIAQYIVEVYNGRFRFRLFDGGSTQVGIATADNFGEPATGQWYFVAAWHDSINDEVGISVNAGTPDTAATTGSPTAISVPFIIGGRDGDTQTFDGRIDEAGIWSRVLTSDELSALYNGGAGWTSYPGCIPVQNDLSWIEDGNFDEPQNSQEPWEWLNAQQRTNGTNGGGAQPNAIAFCGTHMAEVQPNYEKHYTSDSDIWPTWKHVSSLTQRFYWPGGTGYFQARIMPASLLGASVRVTIVKVENVYGPPFGWTPVNGYVAQSGNTTTWNTYRVATSLSAGWYDIDFYETSYDDQLVADFPDPESDDSAAYFVDDVTLSLDAYSQYCDSQYGPTRTPFPTGSRTPTPTRTLTPTSGASPTPSATGTGAPATFANCNFEGGSAGWNGSGMSVQLAGGPVGPQYGQTTGTLYQTFNWSTPGFAFFTYWVGPGSQGSVRVRNIVTQISITLSTHSNPAVWQLRQAAASLNPGTYAIEAVVSSSGLAPRMKLDGVMVSRNTYSYCGSGGSAVTPTSGPTSYVTPTASNTLQYTRTPSNTPTSTPSRTPFATGTAQATYTPRPTDTPQPTNTSQPTNTQEPPEQTATAQGTDVPTFTPQPTFTPYPTYTPYPTATFYSPPPEQPEPNFYADCIRPQNADPGAWTEYSTCYALSWFSWSDINTNEITNYSATAQAKEPFGTISEVGMTLGDFRDLWDSYDWDDTGLADEEADTSDFSQPASGILLGQLDLNNTSNDYTIVCNLKLDDVLGPNVTIAVCFVWGMLKAVGFLSWIQLLWDVLMVWLLVIYIQKAWIAKATMG